MRRIQVVIVLLAFSCARSALAVDSPPPRVIPTVSPEDHQWCLDQLLPEPDKFWPESDLYFRVVLRVQPDNLPAFRVELRKYLDGRVQTKRSVIRVPRGLGYSFSKLIQKNSTLTIKEMCSEVKVSKKTKTYPPGSSLSELARKLEELQSPPLLGDLIILDPNNYELWISSRLSDTHYSWAGLDPPGGDSHPLSSWVWELAEALNLKLGRRAEARKR